MAWCTDNFSVILHFIVFICHAVSGSGRTGMFYCISKLKQCLLTSGSLQQNVIDVAQGRI